MHTYGKEQINDLTRQNNEIKQTLQKSACLHNGKLLKEVKKCGLSTANVSLNCHLQQTVS